MSEASSKLATTAGATEAAAAACCAHCKTSAPTSEANVPTAFLLCGRCRNISYCTKSCQKEHWPAHRPVCSLAFEIFETASSETVSESDPGRGMGIRARRAFSCGDEILREAAILRVPSQQAACSREEADAMHVRSVQTAFDRLSVAQQTAVMSLSSCGQWLNADGGKRTPHGIYQTNSFLIRGGGGGGGQGESHAEDGALFLAVARINHSCRPNVNHIWRWDLQKTLVFATRDIAVGEELLTTYGPSECLDTKGRRAFLAEHFSFDCRCEMCMEGNTLGGDDVMIELHDLHATIPTLVQRGQHHAAIDNIDSCINLLCQHGIGSGVFTKPLLKYGYQVSLMGLHDKKLARKYLAKELKAVIQSEGAGCPESVRLEQMLRS